MIRRLYRDGASVTTPVRFEPGGQIDLNTLPSPDGATQAAVEDRLCDRIDLDLILSRLSPMERDIVRLRYQYHMPDDYRGAPNPTHADIARYITQRYHLGARRGRSVQTVRRILARLATQWALHVATAPSPAQTAHRLSQWDPMIVRLAHRLAKGDTALAEDLAQEGRIVVWRCVVPSQCRSCDAYLRTVITRRMINVANAERAASTIVKTSPSHAKAPSSHVKTPSSRVKMSPSHVKMLFADE